MSSSSVGSIAGLRRSFSTSDLENAELRIIPVRSHPVKTRCKFIYNKGVVCKSDAKVVNTLKEELKAITSRKSAAVADISCLVNERRVTTKTVTTASESLKRKMKALVASLQEESVTSKNAADSIPSMKDPKKQAAAFCSMMQVGLFGHSLQQTAQGIYQNLEEPLYLTALKFFK